MFEVSQPRVTCYRVGIRMDDPRMPAMLVSHNRPGFYLRVWSKARCRRATRFSGSPRGLTDDRCRGRRAALPAGPSPRRRPARAPDSRAQSWVAIVVPRAARGEGNGNAGLAATSPPPAWSIPSAHGHRLDSESDSIVSIHLVDPDGLPVPAALPGQFLTVRLQPEPGQPSLLRNYSLSGRPARTTTGSASSASRTGSAAATCTRTSESATDSTSQHRAARLPSTRTRRRCS